MSEDKEKEGKSETAKREEEILKFWQENDIFKKSVAKDAPNGEFVFYEGPPTANGRPGIHHLEARAFKDAIPRYKTMNGFRVRRRGGWDTHGLPVELEVEKTLGLKSKKDIEEYGIGKFNDDCKKSVWKYVDEWRDFTERIGYWVDLDNPYITYKPEYMESVWNILGSAHKRGLLYQDYRVVPWCTRCGTALSSHELAQGYTDVSDLSVYVKFELVDEPGTYFLAWTTTPWTLPGNVALAVGEKISYIKVKTEGGFLIVAKNLVGTIEGEVIEEFLGQDLVGKKYKPLWPYLSEKMSEEEKGKSFQVYPADFVTTEDGTGIVHTAVMYGQDDFELGTKFGLPKQHLVAPDGTFMAGTDWFTGRFVKDEELTVDIIKDLAGRGLLFKKEKYKHSYPFCWRCKTPLIYYARDSWYIRMSELRDELVSENEKINWEPAHIKAGRFGEWLAGVKDWAISRERYWGTPLPVWRSGDKKEIVVVDSIATLQKYTKESDNKYFVVRHGETEHNVASIVTSDLNNPSRLTEKGKKEAVEAGFKIKDLGGVDVIIVSPFGRTKETASLVAETLGLGASDIIEDERLSEINFGDYEGRSLGDYIAYINQTPDPFHATPTGGESHADVYIRTAELLFECDQKYSGKKILFVTHGAPGKTLCMAATSETDLYQTEPFATGEVISLPFKSYPHNEKFELDLHRPFIDEVVLVSDQGTELRRVPEVMDVWLDSGAMPFAQDHYPFENKEWVEGQGYPADFISEAIDQTRGWFYTLHAVGALMGRGVAYKNVICLGLLQDAEGKKMSKSVGNTVNPWEMMDKYGVDVLRFWMYSVNQPGDSKNFDERTVDEVNKKVFNLLQNVVRFYEMFKTGAEPVADLSVLPVLDRWVVSKLAQLRDEVTTSVDGYDLFTATRLVRDFIGDLSQWYIRRSRDRFKNGGQDALLAEQTTRFVLRELVKIMSPFVPYLAEDVYQKVKTKDDPESVHLTMWPQFDLPFEQEKIMETMTTVREIVSVALEARSKASIKVRQPLATLLIKENLENEYLDIIKDEVNVKEVKIDSAQVDAVVLDVNLNSELVEEGKVRELMREIQDLRKERGLSPSDRISLVIATDEAGQKIVEKFKNEIVKTVGADSLSLAPAEGDQEFSISF